MLADQKVTHPVVLFSHGPNLEYLTCLTGGFYCSNLYTYTILCAMAGEGLVWVFLFLKIIRKVSNVQPECILVVRVGF